MEVLFFHGAGVGGGAVNNGVVGSGNGTVADAGADDNTATNTQFALQSQRQ